MKRELNNQGIAHYLIPVIVLVTAGVVGAFVVVYRHSHNSTQASQTTADGSSGGTQSQDKLTSDASSKTGTSSSKPSASSGSGSSSSSSSSSKSSSSSAKKSTTTLTPEGVLTTIVTSLKNGGQADVTAGSVVVAGPVNSATARPIVFTANGKTYWAYKQGSGADYNQSAASIAGSMAIIVATSHPSTEKAHVDKVGNLVDPDSSEVGYSYGY